jgi:hypothetical protein
VFRVSGNGVVKGLSMLLTVHASYLADGGVDTRDGPRQAVPWGVVLIQVRRDDGELGIRVVVCLMQPASSVSHGEY